MSDNEWHHIRIVNNQEVPVEKSAPTSTVSRAFRRGQTIWKHPRVGIMKCKRCNLAFVAPTSQRCQCKVSKPDARRVG